MWILACNLPLWSECFCLEERKVLYAPPFPILLSQKTSNSSQDSVSLSRRTASLGTWRYLPQEIWSSEACCICSEDEVRRRAAGVQTWRYLPQEIWSSGGMLRAWGCRGMEISSSGGMLRVWGCGGVEVWGSGALEVRCRRVDVEM